MHYYKNFLILHLMILCITMSSHAIAQDAKQDAGQNTNNAKAVAKVIGLAPDATITRNGNTSRLNLKDSIFEGDVIQTSKNGKVQIIFNDESTISLGVDTHFTIKSYSDGEKKKFETSLGGGLMRAVSGLIIKNNPEAFSIKTPNATVGIRGTTLTASYLNGITQVSTENSLNQQSVAVNGIDVPPGQMLTIAPNGASSGPAPMTIQQREFINESFTIGSAATSAEQTYPLAIQQVGVGSFFQENDLNNSMLTMIHQTNTAVQLAQSVVGYANGNFQFGSDAAGNQSYGAFSFKANLLSNTIFNATFNTTTPGAGVFVATNASGTISSNSFTISGGNATFGGSPDGVSWQARGNSGINFGESIGGTLNITAGGQYNGTFTGTTKSQ